MTGFAPKYDLFVFDWDGTVMDTTALIAKGIQHAAREMGYRPRLAKCHSQGRA